MTWGVDGHFVCKAGIDADAFSSGVGLVMPAVFAVKKEIDAPDEIDEKIDVFRSIWHNQYRYVYLTSAWAKRTGRAHSKYTYCHNM